MSIRRFARPGRGTARCAQGIDDVLGRLDRAVHARAADIEEGNITDGDW